MLSILEFPYFNSCSLVRSLVYPGCAKCSPIMAYIAFGKTPESPVVTPSATTQVIIPSAANRYLKQVTVEPIPTTTTTP